MPNEHLDKHDYLQFFRYQHLKSELQAVSQPFGTLAEMMVELLPGNAMRDLMLIKLMEAKDCAVRAKLYTYMGA